MRWQKESWEERRWCEKSELAETERLIISDTAQNISLMLESVT